MKFKIFNKKDDGEEVYFKLVESIRYNAAITLVACDKDGERIHQGNILTINNDGTLKRCTDINDDIGLKLNSLGQIEND